LRKIETIRWKIIEKLKKLLFSRNVFYNDIYKRACRMHAKNISIVLHLGAGRDMSRMNDLKKAENYAFVSLDADFEQLLFNTNKLKVVADAGTMLFKEKVFDAIFFEAFFEHIKYPEAVLSECSRISKKKSLLIFTTPNRLSYISLFNLYAPSFIKNLAIKLRHARREYFPAHYRFNTIRDIHSISASNFYDIKALHYYIGCPGYFDFSVVFWFLFAILHKIIEKFDFLAIRFNIVFVGILERE